MKEWFNNLSNRYKLLLIVGLYVGTVIFAALSEHIKFCSLLYVGCLAFAIVFTVFYIKSKRGQETNTAPKPQEHIFETDFDNHADAIKTVNEYEERQSKIIYEKVIDITHTHYEGRQRIIKELFENQALSNEEFGMLIDCVSDIEDGELMSGKKCVQVVVQNSKGYNDVLGYIPDCFIDELHAVAGAETGYSTDIYINQEFDEYKVKVRVKFYKL